MKIVVELAPQVELEPAIQPEAPVQRLHRHHQHRRPTGEFQRLAIVRHARDVRLQVRHQGMLHAQRVAVVLVEAAVDAELDVACAAIQRDRGGVVGMDLEAHDRGAAVQRGGLGRCEQGPAQPLPLMLRRHRHGVQAGQRRAPVEQDERIAEQLAGALGDQAGGGVTGEEAAKAAPRQPIEFEAAVLQSEQLIEILRPRRADRPVREPDRKLGYGLRQGGHGGHRSQAAGRNAQYRGCMGPAEAPFGLRLHPCAHKRVGPGARS